MKVYITEYALTKGIIEVEVPKEEFKRDGAYIYTKPPGWHLAKSFRLGNQAYTSKEEAIAKAEDMKQKKIISLDKQIKKLEKMTFEVTDNE